MNKIYHIVSATLAMVLLLLTMGSCSKESRLAPETQPEAGAGQLTFKLDNNTLRSVPAEAFEKAVDEHSVWCVFLTSDPNTQTVKVAKPAIETPSGDYTIKADFEGAAQMFVIANVQDALKTKLEGLTTANTLADVQKLVVENALGDNAKAPDNFLMTSDLINVMLPTVGGAPYKVADVIKLKRLAARFDVISEVPGLTLTTISVANRVLSSTLLNVSQTGTNVAATTDYAVDGGKQLLHKIYSYQNTNKGGATGATSFIIKGNYGGKAIKDIKVDLKNVADGQPLDVQRNYCYRIILKPTGDDGKPINPDPNDPTKPTDAWKVTIKVIDWNEAATDLANYSDEDLANQGDKPDPTINLEGVNLLDAVAEYNIDITGTKFTTSHTNEAGYTGYFSFNEAKALQMPKGYHIPTKDEWAAVTGSIYGKTPTVYFNKDRTDLFTTLEVKIPGQKGMTLCQQTAKQVAAESATYMIRYQTHPLYSSAWRYSYVDGPIAGQKVLKIESVPVKVGLTIEELNKDYFANPKVSKYVKTRYLPAIGANYNRNGSASRLGTSRGRGSNGDYWSATEDGGHFYFLGFRSDFVTIDAMAPSNTAAIRPFRNKLQ